MDEEILPSSPLESEEKQSTEASSNSEADERIDVELDRIRDRRENPGQSFLYNTVVPQTFDDYTLVFGLIAGLVFFGSITIASSGLILGNSIAIDDTLSGTLLDPNDCVDKRGEVWIDTWVDHDDLQIESHNAPPSSSSVISVFVWNVTSWTENDPQTEPIPVIEFRVGGLGDLESELSKEDLVDGDYHVRIIFFYSENSSIDWSDLPEDEISEKQNESLSQEGEPGFTIKELEIELHTSDSSSLFGSGEEDGGIR